MREIWRKIPGFPYYEVSSLGQVRSYHSQYDKTVKTTDTPHILKPGKVRGYNQVWLKTEGRTKGVYVHRLVALAFIPNPHHKPDINHIDGNPNNNTVSNLEWCTESENLHHAIYVTKTATVPHHSKLVKCIETGEVFQSAKEAARYLGLSSKNRTIEKICRGEPYHHTCKGLHWVYI